MIDKYKYPESVASVRTQRQTSNSPNQYTKRRISYSKKSPVQKHIQSQNDLYNDQTRSEVHSQSNLSTHSKNSKYLNHMKKDLKFGHQLFNEQLYGGGNQKISLVDIIYQEPQIYKENFSGQNNIYGTQQNHGKSFNGNSSFYDNQNQANNSFSTQSQQNKVPSRIVEGLLKSYKDQKENLGTLNQRVEFMEHYLNSYVFEDLIMKMNQKFEKMMAYMTRREQSHQQIQSKQEHHIKQLESKLVRLQISCSSFVHKINQNEMRLSQDIKQTFEDDCLENLLTEVMLREEQSLRGGRRSTSSNRKSNINSSINQYYSCQSLRKDRNSSLTMNNRVVDETQVIDLSEHHLSNRQNNNSQINQAKDSIQNNSDQQNFDNLNQEVSRNHSNMLDQAIKDETTIFNALKSFADSSLQKQNFLNFTNQSLNQNVQNSVQQQNTQSVQVPQVQSSVQEFNQNKHQQKQHQRSHQINRVISLQNLEKSLEEIETEKVNVSTLLDGPSIQQKTDFHHSRNHSKIKTNTAVISPKKDALSFLDIQQYGAVSHQLQNQNSYGILSDISDNTLNLGMRDEQYNFEQKDHIMPKDSKLNTQDFQKIKTPKFDMDPKSCQQQELDNKQSLERESFQTQSAQITDEPMLTSGKIRDFDGQGSPLKFLNEKSIQESEYEGCNAVQSPTNFDIQLLNETYKIEGARSRPVRQNVQNDAVKQPKKNSISLECSCPEYKRRNQYGCGDFCKFLTADRQTKLVSKAFRDFKDQQKNKRQQQVYIISSKWWRKWTDYVNYNIIQQSFRVHKDGNLSSDGQLNEFDMDELCGDTRYNEPPGIIDNRQYYKHLLILHFNKLLNYSDLIECFDGAQWKLKVGLLENYDYFILPFQVWKMFSAWYGSDKINIQRFMIQDSSNHSKFYLDLYPGMKKFITQSQLQKEEA
eukprot:403359322